MRSREITSVQSEMTTSLPTVVNAAPRASPRTPAIVNNQAKCISFFGGLDVPHFGQMIVFYHVIYHFCP